MLALLILSFDMPICAECLLIKAYGYLQKVSYLTVCA